MVISTTSGLNIPDHWVTYTGGLQIGDDFITFFSQTWGGIRQIVMDEDGFEDVMWGVVTAF